MISTLVRMVIMTDNMIQGMDIIRLIIHTYGNLRIAKGEIAMKNDNNNISNLETDTSDNLNNTIGEAISVLKDTQNIMVHQNELYDDILRNASEINIDDFTWDGSGD
jgi:pectate lyase